MNWCSRNITKDGVIFDPRIIYGMEHMEMPTTASKLHQFTAALQLVRTSIPYFP